MILIDGGLFVTRDVHRCRAFAIASIRDPGARFEDARQSQPKALRPAPTSRRTVGGQTAARTLRSHRLGMRRQASGNGTYALGQALGNVRRRDDLE